MSACVATVLPSRDSSSKATTVLPPSAEASKVNSTSTDPSEASGVNVLVAVTASPSASPSSPASAPSSPFTCRVPVTEYSLPGVRPL